MWRMNLDTKSDLIPTHSRRSMAFFSPFSSRSWSKELWCQPSGVNSISLAFSSTRRLNRDSAERRWRMTNRKLSLCVYWFMRRCRAPTFDESITYDYILSSILRHKELCCKRKRQRVSSNVGFRARYSHRSLPLYLYLPFCSLAAGTCGYLDCFLMVKLTLFCSMLRLMEAAESLSTTDWKLLTDVLLLGLAESGERKRFHYLLTRFFTVSFLSAGWNSGNKTVSKCVRDEFHTRHGVVSLLCQLLVVAVVKLDVFKPGRLRMSL